MPVEATPGVNNGKLCLVGPSMTVVVVCDTAWRPSGGGGGVQAK